MLRRLLALAVAGLLLGAPLAADVCRITCSAHQSAHSTGPHHHSGAMAVPAMGQTMSAVPHVCGHADEVPAGLDQARQVLMFPAIVSAVTVTPPPDVSAPSNDVGPHASPPSCSALSSQLRI